LRCGSANHCIRVRRPAPAAITVPRHRHDSRTTHRANSPKYGNCSKEWLGRAECQKSSVVPRYPFAGQYRPLPLPALQSDRDGRGRRSNGSTADGLIGQEDGSAFISPSGPHISPVSQHSL
jgi:hypothetical protein